MADHRAYRVGSNLTIGPVPFYGAGFPPQPTNKLGKKQAFRGGDNFILNGQAWGYTPAKGEKCKQSWNSVKCTQPNGQVYTYRGNGQPPSRMEQRMKKHPSAMERNKKAFRGGVGERTSYGWGDQDYTYVTVNTYDPVTKSYVQTREHRDDYNKRMGITSNPYYPSQSYY
jgi:hypothetical protein